MNNNEMKIPAAVELPDAKKVDRQIRALEKK